MKTFRIMTSTFFVIHFFTCYAVIVCISNCNFRLIITYAVTFCSVFFIVR